MKKAIQFGAGNIGRGFLGQLFSQSGFETVFVEVRDDLISLINEKKQYKLKILSAQPYEIVIKNIRAVNAKNREEVNKEIKTADIMATAVKSENLASVAPFVRSGIIERAKNGITKPLNLLLCENLPKASKVFKSYLLQNCPPAYIEYINSHLGLVETIISRMVPPVPPSISSQDPLFIMAEEYNELFVDKNAFLGEVPNIKGLVPVENFTAYEQQKLYTYNTGHAVCAYVGYQEGHRYIWEAIRDKKVKQIVR
ncbi:mannitol-1-phosphate 5-dehydrogenase, partial [Candidatus Aerophobetes bacterium]|nr:mannitol-1-phosphate 5-dehydrogenase [Candidatus Aerophobetes bacterium]